MHLASNNNAWPLESGLFGGSTGVVRTDPGVSLVALRRRLSTGLPLSLTPSGAGCGSPEKRVKNC
jgi:hypothetical protein